MLETLPEWRTSSRGAPAVAPTPRRAGLTDFKELVIDILKAALGHRRPSQAGLLMHTDQGSQYTSNEHVKALEAAGITVSMSRRGECWDNAVVESFNSTLKTELVYRTIFLTRGSAQIAIAEWVECLYNRQRRHSTIGCARSREEPIFHFRGTTATQAHQQRDGRAPPHVGRRAADDDLQTTTERTR